MSKESCQLIGGIFPPMLTMFDAEGNLDQKATWNHADWLIRQGVHGLVPAGTSGEFIALDDDERKCVIEIAINVSHGRVPVYACTGYYSTRKTIETTQWAQEAGSTGALVVLPYYQCPPKQAVMEHYRTLRYHTDLPIMAYNIPINSACVELTPWDLADLFNKGVIHGVKSSLVTTETIADLRMLCPPEFLVFYGSFRSPLQGFIAGADGWISGILNFMPGEAVKLYEACIVEKNLEKARVISEQLLSFVHLYTKPLHGPISDLSLWRAGLELRGQHGGFSRKPILPLTDLQREDLKRVMAQVGLLHAG